MRRALAIIVLLMATGAMGCNGSGGGIDPNNLLLGSWHLTSPPDGAAQGCASSYVFAPKTQTMVMMGTSSTIPVTYNASPKTIFLLPEGNIVAHVTYTVLDHNTVRQETAMMCTYQRS